MITAYQNLKYAASDGICTAIGQLSSSGAGGYCTRFVDGFIVTFELLLLSFLLGFGCAILLVLARMSHHRVIAPLAIAFCYLFRGTPLLVQLWVVYFGFGALGQEALGPFWSVFSNSWLVGLLVLTLNTAAYGAEILRGGLVNIHKGQMEAALACGMSWIKAMRHVMLPQAIRLSWPAYGNEAILLMKGSALVSTITVMDLMGQTRTLFSRTYSLEVYLYAALLYLILAAAITALFRVIEQRWQQEATA